MRERRSWSETRALRWECVFASAQYGILALPRALVPLTSGNLGAAATEKRTLVLFCPCSRWRTGLACAAGTGAFGGTVFGGWAPLAPGDSALAVNRPSSPFLARSCGVRGHGVGCCGDRHRERRWSFRRSPA